MWFVIDDAAARPVFVFRGRNDRGVSECTELPSAETAPALPQFVVAVGMGEAVAIELGLGQWRPVKEEDVFNLPKDSDRGANECLR